MTPASTGRIVTAGTGGLPPGRQSATALRLMPFGEIDRTVVVDYHLHTNYTDGSASPKAMAEAAASAGVAEMLFTGHVRHTSTYWPEFRRDVLGLTVPGLNVMVGVETKVLDTDGTLDCSADVASMCDAIVASVHRPPQSEGVDSWSQLDVDAAVDLEFRLAMAIVTKSRANVLAHPMGMTVSHLGLNPLEQLFELAQACKEYEKAFELNTKYCSSPDDWIEIVKRAGCQVSLGSDAHKPADVGSAWRVFVLRDGGAA